MTSITRRQFSAASLALAAGARKITGASANLDSAKLDDVLRSSLQKRGIPTATAIVANADHVTYSGAFGKRDSAGSVNAAIDSIFRIASMTKAITTTAALQLVEQGKVTLDEPVSKHLPELAKLEVLDGFDNSGQPILRPAKTPIALRHLLTHTSGCAYANWSPTLTQYIKVSGSTPQAVAPLNPLLFEPGTKWHYGTSIDWAGKLVEKISGLTLEQYFQNNILQPLGMKSTSFLVAPEKFDRLVSTYRRQPDGKLKEDPRTQPAAPTVYNGGGGLFSTAADYIRFTQMILRKGRGPNKEEILRPKTVELMSVNQIGAIPMERLKSTDPGVTADLDLGPGNKYTYGFMLNTVTSPEGRPAGTLMWAGVENSFYWIDPRRSLCAVIMMQFFPFLDPQGDGMLADFTKAVYA
jgi:CubicO group peptidase (beta-lactamase class C family)